ncbi:MAG: hypothetical protein HYV07_18260 [Deltaproteobacteria bacterium]|nr:hypothetical protein [Deltaproteobacteria bacterium]
MSRPAVRGTFELGALAILASCGGARRFELDVRDGDRVILASVSDAGSVTGVRTVFAGAASIDSIARNGESLVAFVLSPHELHAPEGDRLELDAIVGDGSSVGCGRCLVHSSSPPFLTIPGSVCPIPEWVRATAENADVSLAAVRAALGLVTKGECPCVPPAAGSATLSARLVTPPAEWPYAIGALTGSGRLGLFGAESMRVVESGAVVDRPIQLSGTLLSAAALGEAFAVVSADESEARLQLFDSLGAELAAEANLERARTARVLDADTVVLLGARLGPRPPASVKICRANPLRCADLGTPRRKGQRAQDALTLDAGALVVSLNELGVMIYDRVPDPSDVRVVEDDAVLLSSGERLGITFAVAPIGQETRLGALGDRIFLCGTDEHQRATVMTASVSTGLEPTFEVAWSHDRSPNCMGFFSKGPSSIWLSVGSGLVEFDRAGRVVSQGRNAEVFPILGDQVWSVAPASSRSLLLGSSDRFLVSDATGFELAHGRESWRSSAVLAGTDGGMGLVGRGHMMTFRGDSSEEVVIDLESAPIDATTDRAGRIVALTSDSVVAIDPEDRSIVTLVRLSAAIPALDGFSARAHRPARITRLGTGFLVASAGDPIGLAYVRDGRVDPIEVASWDDPSTPRIEGPFAATTVSGAASAQGVAFVAAANAEGSLVLRVLPGPETATGQRVPWRDSTAGGAAALCADQALLTNNLATSAELVEVRDSPGGPVATALEPLGGPEYRTWIGHAGSRVVYAERRDLYSGSELVSLHGGARSHLDGTIRSYAAFESVVMASTTNGSVWLVDVR